MYIGVIYPIIGNILGLSLRIMEKTMETTIMGLYRVQV